MSHIAGHHSAYFSPTSGSAGAAFVSIGSTREGFRVRQRNLRQPVIDDRGGEAEIDGIMQGAEITVECDYIDYDAVLNCMFTTTGTGAPTVRGFMYDNVGHRLTDLAGQLALTPRPGTPAETEMGVGKSQVFYKAIVDEDIEELRASKLRQGPLRFRCYPDPTNSDKIYAIIATPGGVSASGN